MAEFISDTVFKRDVFSETRAGHFADRPDVRVARRIVTASPLWSRPLAWFLARREIRALRAISGITGTPDIIEVDADGLFRSWTDGTPLHLARPHSPQWYRDARRLLRDMRRRGITHNDLAKPQNWLMLADGNAAVIDFQLASCHRRKGRLYRIMAYEDLRHCLKQKRSFAPHLMTPTERRILARKSLPSRIWMATGKKIYNLITRGIFSWSDGEGTGDRIDREGPAILEAINADPTAKAAALALYPLPRKGVGIYAFIETSLDNIDLSALNAAIKTRDADAGIDLAQAVTALPRREDGTVRDDVLRLIAMNQITELDTLLAREPELAPVIRPIIDGRLNWTDRRISRLEK
ncbi:serine/threonine protein kinase [Hoeflea prorocentri]|uniref:Serine/threonine protein kinase n=1 Tax=Hoeflea prorocentri TaxID=1922333 RepID=A0A9X3UFJ0_9HYPH|nr:serine/threonine protein kinase [Hoeflea prorocentri]MCY6379960.1 serine/threonine protein kinase [Hoeflea prorocentri]MDA5397760.1 serine/threonine protein kinase [Hoeflea prorocentri]